MTREALDASRPAGEPALHLRPEGLSLAVALGLTSRRLRRRWGCGRCGRARLGRRHAGFERVARLAALAVGDTAGPPPRAPGATAPATAAPTAPATTAATSTLLAPLTAFAPITPIA